MKPDSSTLYALLKEIAERAPEGEALVTRDGSLRYGELLERVTQLAGRMEAEGVGRGQRVGLLLSNRTEWLELFYAACSLGATVVPFSTWSTASELAFLVEDSRVDLIFALAQYGERDFLGDLEGLLGTPSTSARASVVAIDESGARDHFAEYRNASGSKPGRAARRAADLAHPEDPLVLLYTSGSSARPKAVPLLHGDALSNGFNIGERMGLVPGDRVFVPVPLFWSYGCINALPAILTHGATMVLQERFEAGEALAMIESQRCTALYTLPAITNALVTHPEFATTRTASLRTGLTIGTPQDLLRVAEELGASGICNIYGSTETYGNCCVTPHNWPLEARSQSQGPPLPGVELRLRDPESGTLCEAGEIGSIEVRGHLTPGYQGDSSRHNPEVFTEDGYFRTGDLGSLDESGRLQFAGRSSEMIKRSGINVSPAEVEEVLQRHPEVLATGVTGTPDEQRDEAIVAFVVLDESATTTLEDLRAHCQHYLSRYKLPDRIELCTELPLTPTGKLMRRELRAMASTGTASD